MPRSVACEANGLRKDQSILILQEKSADGIVGEGVFVPGLETSLAKAGRTHPTEGLNGFRKKFRDPAKNNRTIFLVF